MLEWLRQLQRPTVCVLSLHGKVQAGRQPSSVSYETVKPLLDRAFKTRRLAAVALRLNSPGGSAVQSDLIYADLRRRSQEKSVPIFAFVEDVAASGGYYIACGAGKIFANRHSVVGSIGAMGVHVGLHSGLRRLDIPLTVHRAGKRKAVGSPLEPLSADGQRMLHYVLQEVHSGFISAVRESRGGRLAAGKEEELFEGDVWLPEKAKSLGLIDGVGDLEPTMRKELGVDKLRFVEIKPRTLMGLQGLRAAASALQLPGWQHHLPLGTASTEQLLLWQGGW